MSPLASEVREVIVGLNDNRRQRRMEWADRWNRQPKAFRISLVVLVIAALYVVPLTKPPLINTPRVDFVSLLGTSVVPFVLMALGLNVVVGLAGLLDLGYVGFYAVGAYVIGVLTTQHANLPWLVALPFAVLIAMSFGVVLGAPTLRLRGDYLAIVTLGFGEIIRISAQNFEWLGASEGISGIKRPASFGPVKFSALENRWYWVFGLTLILLVVFLLRRVEQSRVGRAWTAIREDEDAAELMGVPTFKFKLWAFAIGASVGGLAGAFYAGKNITIYPADFQIANSILFLAAVVLGGPGNMWGVIVGGFAIAYLPERFRFLQDKRYLVFGIALVIMMIFRPQGLLPRRQRAAELTRAAQLPDASDPLAEEAADATVAERRDDA
jgi:branched-chain amino acid transport system permease protein